MSAPSADLQLARYSFQRKLDEIAACRGRATELISLYVSPGKQVSDVMSYLRNEYAQSSNIKSRTTRKNVMWAIESLMGRVRGFKEPPPNGVAFFVGNKAIGADKSEPVTFIVEPPEPLNTYLYRCDSSFFLDPLLAMVHEPDVWGLIVMDRAEVTLGLLRGKRVEPLRNRSSLVPSKHGRGGQSQHRFERMIEHAAHEFFVKIAEMAAELFLPRKEQLKGILLGGPGATKEYFFKEGYLQYELQQKVVQPLFDTGYTDEYGLRELVEKATQTLHGLELTEEKRLIQRLLNEIRKADGRPRRLRRGRCEPRPGPGRGRRPDRLRGSPPAARPVPVHRLRARVRAVAGRRGDRRGPGRTVPQVRPAHADREVERRLRGRAVPPGGRIRRDRSPRFHRERGGRAAREGVPRRRGPSSVPDHHSDTAATALHRPELTRLRPDLRQGSQGVPFFARTCAAAGEEPRVHQRWFRGSSSEGGGAPGVADALAGGAAPAAPGG